MAPPLAVRFRTGLENWLLKPVSCGVGSFVKLKHCVSGLAGVHYTHKVTIETLESCEILGSRY